MTAPSIEGTDEDDMAEDTPRRVVVITLGVLLPAVFNDADLVDILPTS